MNVVEDIRMEGAPKRATIPLHKVPLRWVIVYGHNPPKKVSLQPGVSIM
jgi:hypothetical protein